MRALPDMELLRLMDMAVSLASCSVSFFRGDARTARNILSQDVGLFRCYIDVDQFSIDK